MLYLSWVQLCSTIYRLEFKVSIYFIVVGKNGKPTAKLVKDVLPHLNLPPRSHETPAPKSRPYRSIVQDSPRLPPWNPKMKVTKSKKKLSSSSTISAKSLSFASSESTLLHIPNCSPGPITEKQGKQGEFTLDIS